METPKQPTDRCLRIRQTMEEHVRSRLSHALSKLDGKKEDSDTKNKKQRAEERFQLQRILEKGFSAASGIAVGSHIAKGIHPDLKVKKVSNLVVDFAALPCLEQLGSHVLDVNSSLLDTTGDGAYNTAAYDLYRLLDCSFEGIKLSSLLDAKDTDAVEAFQIAQAKDGFAEQCLVLLQSKCANPAVHTQSKQIYWLKDESDAGDNASFEVLAPLFPASLVHQAYLQVQEHRFGEANKAARTARRARKAHEGVFHDYPNLAVQKMGGTKPQNISQLNSERGGVNYLLSSLPPVWKASAVRLPVRASSIFERLFITRPEVCKTVHAMRQFLESDPPPNMETRERRESYTDTLIDELVSCAGELQQLMQPGWTKDDSRFKDLAYEEQLWLDPLRAELPDQAAFAQEWLQMDWPSEIGKRFGRWLNAQLQNRLPVGDVEARFWAKELLTDEDGFKQQLRDLRRKLDGKAVAA